MWQESEGAIGDLLTSVVLGRAEQIDDPVKVSNWWANQGVTIASAELNRERLISLAAECRQSPEPDWVSFLWHVLAWGVMGDYRNAPTIVNSAMGDGKHAALNSVLAAAADASYRGDIRSAYSLLRGKVPRLGPAFFSKFLYFVADRDSAQARCLILDSRVSAAVFALAGLEYFEEKASTYERFCRDVHQWSERFEVPADVIEFRLYQFGRLIDSRRWKWLHAEVSLYREGCKAVDFETIAERRAQLAGWKG
jgi:hypothetical protein